MQSDNGREFDSHAIRLLLSDHGVAFRLLCPHTSQQNGKVEQILRTLNDCVRTLLIHAAAPLEFWAEALATATYLVNRRPCRATGTSTPFQLLFGVPPDYASFVSLVACAIPTYRRPHLTRCRHVPSPALSSATRPNTGATAASTSTRDGCIPHDTASSMKRRFRSAGGLPHLHQLLRAWTAPRTHPCSCRLNVHRHTHRLLQTCTRHALLP